MNDLIITIQITETEEMRKKLREKRIIDNLYDHKIKELSHFSDLTATIISHSPYPKFVEQLSN